METLTHDLSGQIKMNKSLTVVVLLSVFGCQSRQSPPPPDISGRSGSGVDTPVTSFAGFLTDAHMFRLCRSSQQFLVRDLTETLAASLAKLRADSDPRQEVFAVLDGRLGDARGGDAPTTYAAGLDVSFVEYLRIEGFGCEYDWGSFDYRLFGNEPFWAMDITSGVAILNRPGQDAQHWIGMEASSENGVRSFSSPDGALEAVLTPEQCVDSMSGAIYGYTAVVTVPMREFRGCGFASR